MDRLQKTFQKARAEKRVVFCAGEVLGHPTPREFMKRVKGFLDAEPDIIEFSIPFSDPIADGPTIQAAHLQALKAGVTPGVSLKLIAEIRRLTDTPIFIIVYSNIIFKRGIEKFYREAAHAGVDCLLIPDVPLEEIKPFLKTAKKHGIHQVLIASENTPPARLQKIKKVSSGFLYVVTTPGVTGTRKDLNKKVFSLIGTLKKQVKIPLMMGFGISTPEHIRDLKAAGADAVVVCSALVKTPTKKLTGFVSQLKEACV